MATTDTIALSFLSKSLFSRTKIINGKKARTDSIVPRLLIIQNLVLFFSEAGSIWLAFFQKSEPGIKQAKSKIIQIIKNAVVLNVGNRFIFPFSLKIPITSKNMAIIHKITAMALF